MAAHSAFRIGHRYLVHMGLVSPFQSSFLWTKSTLHCMSGLSLAASFTRPRSIAATNKTASLSTMSNSVFGSKQNQLPIKTTIQSSVFTMLVNIKRTSYHPNGIQLCSFTSILGLKSCRSMSSIASIHAYFLPIKAAIQKRDWPVSLFRSNFRNNTQRELSNQNRDVFQWMEDWKKVFAIILIINIAVLLMWNSARFMAVSMNDVSSLRWMVDHFTVSAKGLFQEHRLWTAMTCCFSHSDLLHFGMNMFVLYSFIQPVVLSLGVSTFIGLYLVSGIGSSLASALHIAYRQSVRDQKRRDHPYSQWAAPTPNYNSMGASGCISGLLSYFVLRYPTSQILLFFVLPMPAWAIGGAAVAYDIYRTATDTGGQVDGAGHLGGALVGILWFLARARSGRVRF
ncbi:hypothetical protein BDEG_23893 [Batrachochytrium dendrobatidis JEL423]|uniref:Peptidase S54 rhomboid domain-containing protein n=1 Tax=Batrachochytrium dendrobatidis (strain JEL423) TaxID=403673 RepID=A0A177WK12_BATDL|nr:hypothetical protein BDEG_23893 [Batrachochytrium dendrobatidis JEL423]